MWHLTVLTYSNPNPLATWSWDYPFGQVVSLGPSANLPHKVQLYFYIYTHTYGVCIVSKYNT